jgi:uncharacterized protein (TIGR00730 family)
MRALCVFCGASLGNEPAHAIVAREVGSLLAKRGIRLVYGGGSVGLMGAVADAVLAGGGEVTGVIPHKLAGKEIAHQGLTELVAVETMHERKAQMANRSDAFMVLPGGLGTLEELFEVWSWAQLGFHRKPIGILDTHGYFRPLRDLMDHAATSGFMRRADLELVTFDEDPERLLATLGQRAAATGLP